MSLNQCERCGACHASYGLGQPAQPKQGWYCGKCIDFQPARQKALALIAREAVEDADIIIS